MGKLVRVLGVVLIVAAGVAVSSGSASAVPNPGDTKNCGDFSTWQDAYDWYITYAPEWGDVAHLDSDGDGDPCETLSGHPSGGPTPPTTTPPTSQPPGPSVTPCQYSRWQDAQIAYERSSSAPVTVDGSGVVCGSLSEAPVSTPIAATGAGYMMVERTGTVFGFGDMLPIKPLVSGTVVSVAAGPGGGYWLLTSTGTVHARAVSFFGNVDTATLQSGELPSTIAGLPDGSGYWVFTNRGRAIPFGAAKSYGDMIGTPLNGPVIASAGTPSGKGYWMVGSDGGIFSFGDAQFYGSTGNIVLNKPVVGIAPDPDGTGYWLVASDGGIFAFSAEFKGSTGNLTLNQPVIGALAYGDGYLMVASDGGIFSFSSKPFLGSLGGNSPPNAIVGVAVRPS